MITRQAFDESIFGAPFFRVGDPAAPSLEPEWASIVREHPGAWADARANVDARAVHDRLDRLGFRRICTQVTLERGLEGDPDRSAGPPPTVHERLAMSDAEVDAHARGFRSSRFGQDPRVPPVLADRWIGTWLRNSVSGRKQVIGEGRGVVTFSVDGGALVIDLVSVADPGKGLGRTLIGGIVALARSRGLSRVVVRTEAENVPAMRLYTGQGFRPFEALACFHRVP